MEITNLPVKMLSVCDTAGEITPVRFRLELEDHLLRTVHITQVVSRQAVQYVGIEAFVYLCKAELDERERLFELRYTVRSHKWVLQRLVY